MIQIELDEEEFFILLKRLNANDSELCEKSYKLFEKLCNALFKRNKVNVSTCYICDKDFGKFLTTPLLELPDKTLAQCCEECADREFPHWREDDDPD